MSAEIKKLKPEAIWSFFYDLTQIPRPTGQMKEVVEYIKGVGVQLGLETKVDKTGNVLISKPASEGMEDRPVVALQGHLDMVPQKNSHVNHDFTKDPIDAWIDGDWVKARETTLGADNGIGSAMALAILADKDLKHGPIEALFTVDEEVGMVGAFGLEEGFCRADYMLNLDSEVVDELYIGCAGGVDINVSLDYKDEVKPQAGDVTALISISGLKGGHSGVDIHLGRGNANKMLVRVLKKAYERFDLSLVELQGGSLRNAIPREATAKVMVPSEQLDDLKKLIAEYEDLYNFEYKSIENKITLSIEQENSTPNTIVPQDIAESTIQAIEACQNGVITYLSEFPGTVEASSNLAFMHLGNGSLEVKFLTRSSSESRKEMVASSVESAFSLIGAKVEFDGDYNGWQPDAHSHILEVMTKVFNQMNGEKPAIKVMHAGLECGIIQGVMPNTQMISFGPTISHPHSPDEKVNIPSVAKTWDLLVRTLEEI